MDINRTQHQNKRMYILSKDMGKVNEKEIVTLKKRKLHRLNNLK